MGVNLHINLIDCNKLSLGRVLFDKMSDFKCSISRRRKCGISFNLRPQLVINCRITFRSFAINSCHFETLWNRYFSILVSLPIFLPIIPAALVNSNRKRLMIFVCVIVDPVTKETSVISEMDIIFVVSLRCNVCLHITVKEWSISFLLEVQPFETTDRTLQWSVESKIQRHFNLYVFFLIYFT